MPQGKKTLSISMIIFGFFMVAVFIFIGLVLLYSSYYLYIKKEVRVIFAFFFIVYGIFRLVRTIFKLKEHKEFYNNENDEL
ncbi:MAG: hypothetical protein WC223_07535 [Bacteroidales bacterium]|jgi:hypothetical protein